MTVRTRVAPSPTGEPHVGTAYIALFNLCFAKKLGGQFIVRTEDTDQTRSSHQFERNILESLRWMGLDWDEGPDIGGPYGPYRQSERTHIYQKYADILQKEGHAFRCFCSSERLHHLRLEQMKNKQPLGYDGHCLHLSQQRIQAHLNNNDPYVVRLRVPESGQCQFDDMLRGSICIDWSQIDQQILLKADGFPTYHLANVVDDHLMGITHVIRGEEWINSAPKHQLLYDYLGWEMPKLCHMPLLRNPDKSKLSKRKNPTTIGYYQRMGFLPEAMLNYLGRMGWSMPNEQEKFSLQEMIEHFDLQRISLGGPIFDQEKLRWLNSTWIREELSVAEFGNRLKEWALREDYIQPVAELIKNRTELLSDVVPMTAFLFAGMLEITPEQFQHKTLSQEQIRHLLQYTLWDLDALAHWEKEALFDSFKQLATQMTVKTKDLMSLLFISIAGTDRTVSILDAMMVLGPELSKARIRHALAILGGVSKKEMKHLQKLYEASKQAT